VAGLEGGDLRLLLADHVEEAVLPLSVPRCRDVMDTHHLALLLVLELLMHLSQAGCALMVRAMRPWTPATGRGALLHLTRCWHGRVVEVQVHADAGPAACALDFPTHTTRG
jgi:hypothetical protein